MLRKEPKMKKTIFIVFILLTLLSGARAEFPQQVEYLQEEMLDGYESRKNNDKDNECGPIAVEVVRNANAQGIEVWAQGGVSGIAEGNYVYTGGIGHVLVGTADAKQIYFVNASQLETGGVLSYVVPTGTLNYKKALSAWEKKVGRIPMLQIGNGSEIGTDEEILFPVKSYGQEILEEAAGFFQKGGINKELSKKLFLSKIEYKKGLDVEFGEKNSLQLNYDRLGFAIFSFHDSKNDYNALADLMALQNTIRLGGGNKFNIEIQTTILDYYIKNFTANGKKIKRSTTTERLLLNYVNFLPLNNFMLTYGVILEGGMAIFSDIPVRKNTSATMMETSLGARLTHKKIFVEIQDDLRLQSHSFSAQYLVPKEARKQITVGINGDIATEITLARMDYGHSVEYKKNLSFGKVKLGLIYLTENSNYERFLPDKKRIDSILDYQFLSNANVSFSYSLTKEKYKDAETEKSSAFGAELKYNF